MERETWWGRKTKSQNPEAGKYPHMPSGLYQPLTGYMPSGKLLCTSVPPFADLICHREITAVSTIWTGVEIRWENPYKNTPMVPANSNCSTNGRHHHHQPHFFFFPPSRFCKQDLSSTVRTLAWCIQTQPSQNQRPNTFKKDEGSPRLWQ